MKDIIIGIDAGTSVIKSVAFTLQGDQLATAATQNHYTLKPDGTASQPLLQTWRDCVSTLRDLAETVPMLAKRTAAIAITAQGDGTWLIDDNGEPVGDAWLWLDARSAPTVERLRASDADAFRFETTGTGLNCTQQGAQLAHMQAYNPELLRGASTAMHCKDWLYFNFTGERVTDPSEGNFTFGDYRSRQYSDEVIECLGLTKFRHLLPPMLDGSQHTHCLNKAAAAYTGLLAGTPVCLGYLDVACTGLGAGLYTPGERSACSILGSTGMHMRCTPDHQVSLNRDRTGYVMVLPVPETVAQIQSNMAATLNIDWLLDMAVGLSAQLGHSTKRKDLLHYVDDWVDTADPGTILYQPYISEAGERGPFTNNHARAGFVGLNQSHGFGDLLRSVLEGLGLAARDCYQAMGSAPAEVRLTGGSARSSAIRRILAATLDAPVRCSAREEAGAAGAAMMAAVSIGFYTDMDECVSDWVTPLLEAPEKPDAKLAACYRQLFPQYRHLRSSLAPVWSAMANARQERLNEVSQQGEVWPQSERAET